MSGPPPGGPPSAGAMTPALPSWIEPGPLREALEFIARPVDREGRKSVYTLYAEADARAVTLRRRHYRLAFGAAALGLAAVLLALYQLAHWALVGDPHHPPDWLATLHGAVSIAAMVVAALAAAVGVYSLCASALRRRAWPRPWRPRAIAAAAGLASLLLLLGIPVLISAELHAPAGEFAMMAIAVFAVVYGVWTGAPRGWILNRSKAERLHQLKYAFLASPAVWAGGEAARSRCEEEFQDGVQAIDALTFESLQSWLLDRPARPFAAAADVRLEEVTKPIDQLRRYYRETRFWDQVGYFSEGTEPRHAPVRLTRHLPASIFFLAPIVVGLHFLLDLVFHSAGAAHEVRLLTGVSLLVLAVGLPALGAAVRTWRLSQEFDRNALRAQTTAVALMAFAERLRGAQAPAELLRTLGDCEDIFESEHREWLRLMIEAEWFG